MFMADFPADALPPNPATVDPLLQDQHDPLTLPAEPLEDLELVGRSEGYESPEWDDEQTTRRHPAPEDDDEDEDEDEDEREPVTLTCRDLERLSLWDTADCCHDLCHTYKPMRPEPLHYRHITVDGCCHSLDALNHLEPPPDDFLRKLFA